MRRNAKQRSVGIRSTQNDLSGCRLAGDRQVGTAKTQVSRGDGEQSCHAEYASAWPASHYASSQRSLTRIVIVGNFDHRTAASACGPSPAPLRLWKRGWRSRSRGRRSRSRRAYRDLGSRRLGGIGLTGRGDRVIAAAGRRGIQPRGRDLPYSCLPTDRFVAGRALDRCRKLHRSPGRSRRRSRGNGNRGHVRRVRTARGYANRGTQLCSGSRPRASGDKSQCR